jgi:hypothetical protein
MAPRPASPCASRGTDDPLAAEFAPDLEIDYVWLELLLDGGMDPKERPIDPLTQWRCGVIVHGQISTPTVSATHGLSDERVTTSAKRFPSAKPILAL